MDRIRLEALPRRGNFRRTEIFGAARFNDFFAWLERENLSHHAEYTPSFRGVSALPPKDRRDPMPHVYPFKRPGI